LRRVLAIFESLVNYSTAVVSCVCLILSEL